MHLPLSWWARFVSANSPFLNCRHFSRKLSSETRNRTNFTSYLQFWISNQRKSTMDDNSNMAPNSVPWNKSSQCYCSHDKVREFHLTFEKSSGKHQIVNMLDEDQQTAFDLWENISYQTNRELFTFKGKNCYYSVFNWHSFHTLRQVRGYHVT